MTKLFLPLALALALTASSLAFAGQSATVGIGSTKVITIAAVSGLPAEKRAHVLQVRLIEILSVIRAGQDPEVRVALEDSGPALFVKGIRFVTVTAADCRLHKSAPLDLARVWAKRLDQVLRATAPENRPDDFLPPGSAKPEVTLKQEANHAGVPGARTFTITVAAHGLDRHQQIQVIRQDDGGRSIVARTKLDPGEATRVTVATGGAAIFEVIQNGVVVWREQLPFPKPAPAVP